MPKKIMKTEIFQGNLAQEDYFEGWYIKFVSKDTKESFALICGVSLKKDDKHAFIQYLNGSTGGSEYFRFHLDDFWTSEKTFEATIEKNKFSTTGVEIDLKNKNIHLKGTFSFSEIRRYPKNIFVPSVMGWFAYVPRMECNHGVVSMHHKISGVLEINKTSIDYNNGNGYIEKDWGISFPEKWIWMQTNSFAEEECSFMLSAANIPWMKRKFNGFLSFIYYKGKVYRFATYTGAKIIEYKKDDSALFLKIRNGKYLLKIWAKMGTKSPLIAPTKGKMERIIQESINSEIKIELINRFSKKIIIEGTGVKAGLEISGDIAQILK